MSDHSRLRAADAERGTLDEELREHMLAGRLAPGKFEERSPEARSAHRTARGRRHSERTLLR
jgi:hypothetical protein